MKNKNSGPFLRGRRGVYYCWIDGRLRSLRTDKPRLADARYARMLIDWKEEKARKEAEAAPPAWTVRRCFDHYLEYAATLDANSHRNRRQTLDAFRDEARVGELPWSDLTVDHLEAWVGAKGWSASTRRTKINYVMAAFNYCVKRKKIAENPIHGVEKPRWERRKRVIAADDEAKVFEAAKGPFRDILAVLRSTGARPNELCSARVEHYRAGVITLGEHKEDEAGDDRVIYLTEEGRGVVERLIGTRAEGPIFRNTRGDAWTPDTLYCRFKRLKERLGLGEGVFPYAVRHRFTSDAINDKDANPALVARQLGHAGLEQLMKHYFREDPEAVRRALEEIARKR